MAKVQAQLNKDGTISVVDLKGQLSNVAKDEAISGIQQGLYKPASIQDSARLDLQAKEAKQYNKPAQAFVNGLISSATFGLSDHLVSDESKYNYKKTQEVNPKAELAGELASFLIPGSAPAKMAKWAAKTDKTATVMQKLGKVAAKETLVGGSVGIGQGIADTARNEMETTEAAKHVLKQGGLGALFGGGVSLGLGGAGIALKKGLEKSSKAVGRKILQRADLPSKDKIEALEEIVKSRQAEKLSTKVGKQTIVSPRQFKVEKKAVAQLEKKLKELPGWDDGIKPRLEKIDNYLDEVKKIEDDIFKAKNEGNELLKKSLQKDKLLANKSIEKLRKQISDEVGIVKAAGQSDNVYNFWRRYKHRLEQVDEFKNRPEDLKFDAKGFFQKGKLSSEIKKRLVEESTDTGLRGTYRDIKKDLTHSAGDRIVGSIVGGSIGGPMGYAAGAIIAPKVSKVFAPIIKGVTEGTLKAGTAVSTAYRQIGISAIPMAQKALMKPQDFKNFREDLNELDENKINKEEQAKQFFELDEKQKAFQQVKQESLNNAIMLLKEKIPQPPKSVYSIDGVKQNEDNWIPSEHDRKIFNRYYETVSNPNQALENFKNGNLTSEEKETLERVFPVQYNLMKEMIAKEIQNEIDAGKHFDPNKKHQIAKMLGGGYESGWIKMLQSNFAKPQNEQQPSRGRAKSRIAEQMAPEGSAALSSV